MAAYTDNFNAYTTGNLPGQGLWVDMGLGGGGLLHATGTTVTDNSALTPKGAYYNNTVGANQYSEVQNVTMTANSDQGIGPVVRTGTRTGYFAQCNTAEIRLYKVTDNTGTPAYAQIGTTWTGTLANNDTIRLEASGTSTTTFVIKRNGTPLSTPDWSDSSTPHTSGFPGMMSTDTPVVMDNWAGGDLAAGSTSASISASASASASASVSASASASASPSGGVSFLIKRTIFDDVD